MFQSGQLIPGIWNRAALFRHEAGCGSIEWLRSPGQGGRTMNDVSLLVTLIGFFLLSALYVRLCGGL